MTTRRVEIALDAPTCIAQRPTSPGQVTTTLAYLTGTVLRGALAARWLAGRHYRDLQPPDDQLFRDLFLSGKVQFGNGLPAPPRSVRNGMVWIVPQTAWTEKRRGGWKEDQGSGVYEVLHHLLRDEADDREALDGLDRLGQDFALERTDSGAWGQLTIRRRLITRGAINPLYDDPALPSREVAAPGQLYTFEALESGQRFMATISGPDPLMNELGSRALTVDAPLTLGRRRSAGDGLAHIVSITTPPAPARAVATLRSEIEDFSTRSGAANGMRYLPVTLDSDVILRDNYLLPCSSGDPQETLRRYRPGVPPSLRLLTAVQRTRWIGGWDMIRGLPRAPRLAVQAGSVWVYTVTEGELDDAIAWWLEAERDGIGELLDQGFGRVQLMHPMHAEDRNPW